MKLAFCPRCWDVFKLARKWRQCECGMVVGRYKDNLHAEVSERAVSLAIGNDTLELTVKRLQDRYLGQNHLDRDFFEKNLRLVAWVRPNSGLGNPHTDELREVKANPQDECLLIGCDNKHEFDSPLCPPHLAAQHKRPL
jgi:hypothetical protein